MVWPPLPKLAYRMTKTATDQSEVSRTQVDLLRHGEHALGDVVAGVSDPKLTAKGWQQLVDQTEMLSNAGAKWELCLSSPRKRCAEFAANLSKNLGVDFAIDEGFAEVDFGVWETMAFSDIEAQHPGEWRKWLTQKQGAASHGGETYHEFLARIDRAWSNLLKQHQGKKVLLFMHGGVARAIFVSALKLDADTFYQFNVPHACHSRLMAYHMQGQADWFQLEAHNTGFKP